MNNVSKLKNLLVSSCQSIKEGHRDIAVNLLELAADLMEEQDISPEVIETQFITAVNDNPEPTEFEAASDDEVVVDPESVQHVTSDELKNIAITGDVNIKADTIAPGTESTFTEAEIVAKAAQAKDDAEVEAALHITLRSIIDNWGIGNVSGKTA